MWRWDANILLVSFNVQCYYYKLEFPLVLESLHITSLLIYWPHCISCSKQQLYLRYLEDIFIIWPNSWDDFNHCFQILNSHHLNITLKSCIGSTEYVTTQVALTMHAAFSLEPFNIEVMPQGSKEQWKKKLLKLQLNGKSSECIKARCKTSPYRTKTNSILSTQNSLMTLKEIINCQLED